MHLINMTVLYYLNKKLLKIQGICYSFIEIFGSYINVKLLFIHSMI